jgi:predicted transcriptional regulator
MGKSKEISQDLRKKCVDLHKSGSSVGAISKRLKVPRSSVQTIVQKYKYHGTTQPSYHKVSSRGMYFGVKSANKSQNNSKGPCEDPGGNRYTIIYIHIKTNPIST